MDREQVLSLMERLDEVVSEVIYDLDSDLTQEDHDLADPEADAAQGVVLAAEAVNDAIIAFYAEVHADG